MKIYKNLCVLLTLLTASSLAFAGPECTKEPKDKWQNQEKFKQTLIDQGYKIKVLKVTDGNCYELYGSDKEGTKVEIYFNPVTGEKVTEEKHGK